MKKLFFTTGLMFAFVGFAQAVEITNTNATGTTFKFSATLNAPLTAGNKVKIDFGKGGLKAMTCSAKTCTLSSNALPTGISTATYKIGIYDAKNVLQGSTSDGTYVITSNSSAPVSNYTKIANDGSELSDSAKLGSNPKDWACTKDNKTGLIWEVKTTDGGLRDMNKTYTNYTENYPKCDDAGFVNYCNAQGYTGKYGDSTNTDGVVSAVNKQGLCDKNDWRLPTNEELKSLVLCSDGKMNTLGKNQMGDICSNNKSSLTINTSYFPNTVPNHFWSSSLSTLGSLGSAWGIYFSDGFSAAYANVSFSSVRLVRNTQ